MEKESDAVGSLADLLTEWLPRQRWFAAKSSRLQQVSVASQNRLAEDLDGAAVDHLLIEVGSGLGTQHYQMFIGWRPMLPAALQRWLVGELDGVLGYDALHDPAVTAELLRRLATGEKWGDISLVPEPGAQIDLSTSGRVIAGEQSNTSIIYGNGILKVYRRLEPGTNPDVDVHRALHGSGSFHVARPLAVMEGDLHGQPTTLGFLSSFFADAADGWELATATVRRRMDVTDPAGSAPAVSTPDFSAESQRLGRAVAEIHRDLAGSFGVVELDGNAWSRTLDGMVAEAERVAEHVPSIAERLDAIRATFHRARSLSTAVVVQRVHGDLHLGQTLRTPTGWAVIDFEGEPAKGIDERKQRQLPAKDIAGMLRSFDYAANHLRPTGLADDSQVSAAGAWARENREAFLAGYSSAGVDDVVSPPAVLTAFELDKAVYEVAYEHSNRPEWESIPLHAVDELTTGTAPSDQIREDRGDEEPSNQHRETTIHAGHEYREARSDEEPSNQIREESS